MIIAFAGHSSIPLKNRVKELVKEYLRNNIVNEKSVCCYVGGYGDFDEICARVCNELKEECTGIEVIYVSPYMTLSEQTKIKEMLNYGLFDSSIYPPIENVPPKFAILKRNEWIMKNADLIIAYVNCTYGGAYKSIQVAKSKKKRIINICDYF